MLKIKFLTLALMFSWASIFCRGIDKGQEKDIDHYIAKAKDLRKYSKFDSAINYLDSAIIIATNTNDQYNLAWVFMYKGGNLFLADQYDLAKVYLKKGIQGAKSVNSNYIMASSENILANVFLREGIIDSALHHNKRAIDLYKEDADTAGVIRALLTRSWLYQRWGDWANALEYAMESNSLAKHENYQEKFLLNTLLNLANLYDDLEEYDKALSHYTSIYEKSLENNDLSLAHAALSNQAVIHYTLENYEESKKKYLQAIEYREKTKELTELARLYSNLSQVYKELGQYQQALQSVKKAVEIAREINDAGRQVNSTGNLASIYKEMGEYEKAEYYFKEALQLAERSNFKKEMKIAYLKLSDLYKEIKDYNKALEYYEKYSIINDSILNETKIKAIKELEAKYENKEKEASILRLQNVAVKKEREKDRMQRVRNVTIIISVFVIVFLSWITIYFTMKVKKNRIISTQRIKQLEDEKRLMAAQSALLGQEEERKRIAQELHDGIGVLLSTASIHFSGLVGIIKDLRSKELINKANEMLKQATAEVRKISHNMMPGVLAKFGLKEALEDLFDGLNETDQIKVEYEFDLPDERLPEKTEIILYRVIQEMVNNTLQHASAKMINFSMNQKLKILIINYSDDGIGFDPDAELKSKGLGISGIHSRIDYLKGRVELETSINNGTTYKILIPS